MNYDRILQMLHDALANTGPKRSVLKPRESVADYFESYFASRQTKDEFDRQRLLENGWDDIKEAKFQQCKRVCGPRDPKREKRAMGMDQAKRYNPGEDVN